MEEFQNRKKEPTQPLLSAGLSRSREMGTNIRQSDLY